MIELNSGGLAGSTLVIGQTQPAGHTPGPSPMSSPAAVGSAADAADAAAASAGGSACEGAWRRTPVGAVYCRPPPPPPPPPPRGGSAARVKGTGYRWGEESEDGLNRSDEEKLSLSLPPSLSTRSDDDLNQAMLGKAGAPWRRSRGRRSRRGRAPSRCRAPPISSPGSARSCAGGGWAMSSVIAHWIQRKGQERVFGQKQSNGGMIGIGAREPPAE